MNRGVNERISRTGVALRILFGLILVIGSAGGHANPEAQGLEQTIDTLQPGAMPLADLLEEVENACGLQVKAREEIAVEVTIARPRACAREILNEALGGCGLAYIVEEGILHVMKPETLAGYFRSRAQRYHFEVSLDAGTIRMLTSTPGIVSAAGLLEIHPGENQVVMYDLPEYVQRVREMLFPGQGNEEGIVL